MDTNHELEYANSTSEPTLSSEKPSIGLGRSIRFNIRPYRLVRDVLLVELFASWGGFIVGYVCSGIGADPSPYIPLSSAVSVTIGMSIVGSINSKNRWVHLAVVTIAMFLFDSIFGQHFNLITVCVYAIYFFIGGLLSMLYPVFRNRD